MFSCPFHRSLKSSQLLPHDNVLQCIQKRYNRYTITDMSLLARTPLGSLQCKNSVLVSSLLSIAHQWLNVLFCTWKRLLIQNSRIRCARKITLKLVRWGYWWRIKRIRRIFIKGILISKKIVFIYWDTAQGNIVDGIVTASIDRDWPYSCCHIYIRFLTVGSFLGTCK